MVVGLQSRLQIVVRRGREPEILVSDDIGVDVVGADLVSVSVCLRRRMFIITSPRW